MKSGERITLGWIDPGLVEGMFAVCLTELFRRRSDLIAGCLRVEGSLLSRLRNEIVKNFLQSRTDWLLMVDSDEQLTVPTFDKLVAAAHSRDRPVVAGLYFGTMPGNLLPIPVPHLYREANDGTVGMTPVMDYPADSLVDIDAAGTGALLIHRSVLEAIRESADEHEGPDWCWFRDLPVGGEWLGEDMYFCRRIKSLGFPIVAHTGAVLAHKRRYWLDQRQHEALRARPVEREEV